MREYLKRINKIVKDCKRMEIFSNEETSFDHLLPNITDFLSNVAYDDTLKYEKDLQIQIANKLWNKRICSLNFFLYTLFVLY